MADTTRPLALVTGGTLGIGLEFSRQLAEKNYDLLLVARDEKRLQKVAAELESSFGVAVQTIGADLTNTEHLGSVDKAIKEHQARLALLVNNAGFGTVGDFHKSSLDTELYQLALNVEALVWLTHTALDVMLPKSSGAIINVSSVAGFQPSSTNPVYSATKAFVTSFSQGVAEQVRSKRVKVMALAPGIVPTGFQERAGVTMAGVPKFLILQPDFVVRKCLSDLEKGKTISIPGGIYRALAGISSIVPDKITMRILQRATR